MLNAIAIARNRSPKCNFRTGLRCLFGIVVAFAPAALIAKPAVADEAVGRITGRVTDDTGAPVAGTRIQVIVCVSDSIEGLDGEFRHGVSDSDGSYAIDVPRGHVRFQIPRPPAGHFANLDFSRIEKPWVLTEISVTADEPARVMDIDVHRGAILAVSLDDALRKAASAVTVNRSGAERFSFVSHSIDSSFTRVTLPSDGGNLMLGAYVENRGTLARAELEVEPGFRFDQTEPFALNTSGETREVLDVDGRRMTLRGAMPKMIDGTLVVHILSDAPEKQRASVHVLGRVVDAENVPIANAGITFGYGEPSSEGWKSPFSGRSAADGTFVVEAELRDDVVEEVASFFLIVTAKGHAPVVTQAVMIPTDDDTIHVAPIVMPTGYTMRVRVVNEKGQPAEGAWVEASEHYLWVRRFAKSDSSGRCEIRNLPAGLVRVDARLGRLMHSDKLVVDQRATDDEVTLRLRPLPRQGTEPEPFPDPPPIGAAAPEFSVVGWTDGEARTLADFRGKVVVLDFWGIWCSACLNAIDAQKALQSHYADNPDVVFLGIHSAGTDVSQVNALMRHREWNLTTGVDQGSDVGGGAMARAYGVHGWPTTVVIGRDGKIAHNDSLEEWDQVTMLREQLRISKALNLAPLKAEATFDEQVAHTNAMRVFRYREFIDRALGADDGAP